MHNKSINVYMSQGLGNQLFIYSFILNLIESNNASDLDIKILFNRKSKKDREFLLQELIKFDSDKISFNYNRNLGYFLRIFLCKIIKKEKVLRKLRIFHEKFIFSFEENLLYLPTYSLVIGYYISTKYVDRVLPILENRITRWLSAINNTYENLDVNSADVVVLHIRRGDTVGKIAEVRGLLSVEYYKNALKIISLKQKRKPCKIIAITDDLIASKKALEGMPITHWFGPNDLSAVEALKIFKTATNFIGANSTLSWWGAKLSDTSDSNIQILPKPWLGFKESIADQALFIPTATYIRAE